jgi:hypothetical protein
MIPQIILWIRSANRYVLIGIIVIIAILSVAFYPVFIASFVSYKLYSSSVPRILVFIAIGVLWLVLLPIQGWWIDFLMDQYFPRVEIPF